MKVVYREDAIADLAEIRSWYAERNPSVSRSLLAKVRARVRQLSDYPELGPRSPGRDARTLLVANTPFVVIYRVDHDAAIVDIVAVIDARRHPSARFRE